MKKTIFLIFIFVICVGVDLAQSIRITYPHAGETLYKKNRYTITWDRSGNLPGEVTIVLFKGDRMVGNIKDLTPNDGSYSWYIRNGIAEGSYKIRIVANGTRVFDDSENFVIAESREPAIPLDLEMKEVSYVHRQGGWITGLVKTNTNEYRGRLKFRVVFPGGGMISGNTLEVTRRIRAGAGEERRVYLVPSSQLTDIPFCGRSVSVRVDPDGEIPETNELNNQMTSKVYSKIADLIVSSSGLEIKKVYGDSRYRWRIIFRTHLRGGGSGYTAIPSIELKWVMRKRGTNEIRWQRRSSIVNLSLNQERTVPIVRKFGHPDLYTRAPIILEEGVYIITITATGDNICEKILHNNIHRIAFELK